jgi:HPt (histidine-containing phosphotransfer) domain-containing protein
MAPSKLDAETLAALREIMGENFNLIIETFLSSSEGLIEDLQNGFNTMDFSLINKAAHPLKSSSRQVGATGLASCAEKIEHQAADENPDGLEALFAECQKQYREATVDLKALLN